MANRYPLILNASAGQLQELPVGDTLDLGGEGIVGIGLGSVEAPSISFDSDANTGVYSPGADQVAISTNGEGRLFVGADGEILVNTTSRISTEILSVAGTICTAGGTNSSPGIAFRLDPDTGLFRPTAQSLAFSTAGAERLRINAAGRLGLGISTPGYLLHLSGSTSAGTATAQIALGSVLGTPSSRIDGYRADGSYRGQLHFYTTTNSGTELRAVTIDQEQRVGIGTSSPTTALQVTKSGDDNLLTLFRNENVANTQCGILFKDRNAVTGGQNVARIYSIRQSLTSNFDLAFETSDGTGAPYRQLTIKADGKVGIGTTSPGSALEINAAAATSPFIAKINTSEVARIDSSGRLGLGTSSPENRLHIVGTSATTNAGATVLVDDSASLAADIGGSIAFRGVDDGGSNKTYGIIRGGKLNAGSGFDGYLALETRSNGQANTTERLRITHAGNVGIGVTVPSSLLHLADAGNITVGTTTGTKIGTATSQKIGFYNATPVVQPTTGIAEAAFVENSGGTAVNVDSTFGGYTIQQVVQALQTLGLLA